MKVSIIIPCYNEEGNIQQCLRRIPPLEIESEYVVVDDGSNDNTRQKVLEIMQTNPRVRLVALDCNQGKAKAVKAGIEQARGEIVMILDADMTVKPEETPLFLETVMREKNVLVMGTRFVYPFDKKAMRWVNRISNRITAWFFSK
jgi:glycosyltransferase involved in cell wall biosynthesis